MDKRQDHLSIKMPASLLAVLLLCVTPFTHANDIPDFTARYIFEKQDTIIGYTTYKLKQTGDTTEFSLGTELAGIAAWLLDDRIEEKSILKKNGDQLLLTKYIYRHHGSRKNKNVTINIVWDKDENGTYKGHATGTARGKEVDATVNSSIRDALSFQLSLMRDVNQNINTLSYKVFSKDQIRNYDFKVIGDESINNNNKKITTTKILRDHGDKLTYLWLNKELHNLPMQIERHKDDEVDTRMTLDFVKFDNAENE